MFYILGKSKHLTRRKKKVVKAGVACGVSRRLPPAQFGWKRTIFSGTHSGALKSTKQ